MQWCSVLVEVFFPSPRCAPDRYLAAGGGPPARGPGRHRGLLRPPPVCGRPHPLPSSPLGVMNQPIPPWRAGGCFFRGGGPRADRDATAAQSRGRHTLADPTSERNPRGDFIAAISFHMTLCNKLMPIHRMYTYTHVTNAFFSSSVPKKIRPLFLLLISTFAK